MKTLLLVLGLAVPACAQSTLSPAPTPPAELRLAPEPLYHLRFNLVQDPVVVAGYGFKSRHAVGGLGYPFLELSNRTFDPIVRGGLFSLTGDGFRVGPGVWFPTGSLGRYVEQIATLVVPKQADTGNLDWLREAGKYVAVGIGYIPNFIGSGASEVVVMGQVQIPVGRK